LARAEIAALRAMRTRATAKNENRDAQETSNPSAFLCCREFCVGDDSSAGFFCARFCRRARRGAAAGVGAGALHTKLSRVTVIFFLL
jgi:hypothetical protein